MTSAFSISLTWNVFNCRRVFLELPVAIKQTQRPGVVSQENVSDLFCCQESFPMKSQIFERTGKKKLSLYILRNIKNNVKQL